MLIIQTETSRTPQENGESLVKSHSRQVIGKEYKKSSSFSENRSQPGKASNRFTLNLSTITSNGSSAYSSDLKKDSPRTRSYDSDEGIGSNSSSPKLSRFDRDSPRMSRKFLPVNRRIFVWDVVSERCIAVLLEEISTLRVLMNTVKRKLECTYTFQYVFYKKNNAEILSVNEIRENDELIVSPTLLKPRKLSVSYDKSEMVFSHQREHKKARSSDDIVEKLQFGRSNTPPLQKTLVRSNSENDIRCTEKTQIKRRWTICTPREVFFDENEFEEDLSQHDPESNISSGLGAINPFELSKEEIEILMTEMQEKHMDKVEIEEGEIVSGSLNAFMLRLTTQVLDQEFTESFLLTYDLFISHELLLKTFILLFRHPILDTNSSNDEDFPFTPRGESPDIINDPRQIVIQHRIFMIVSNWVALRYDVIRTDPHFVSLFNRFVDYIKESTSSRLASLGNKLLQVWNSNRRKRHETKRNLLLSKPGRVKGFDRNLIPNPTSIPSMDLARQLSIMEQDIYGRTHLKEYFTLNFSKGEKKAPHITAMTKQFNRISYWVASLVVSPTLSRSSKQRGGLIDYFIRVMDDLKSLNNFNSMFQIYSALNMLCVSRLQKAWSHVTFRSMSIFAETARLFDSNYKEYRHLTHVTEPPCIPIQQIILRDLTFIEENPTLLENNWINFEKLALLGKTYRMIKRFQSAQYNFKSNNTIYEWILSYPIPPEEQLANDSMMVEPTDEFKSKIKEERRKEKKIAKERKKVEHRKSALIKIDSKPTTSNFQDDSIMSVKKEFIDHITNTWYTLDFDDKSPTNLKNIVYQASKIFVRFISATSECPLKFKDDMVSKLKESLKNPQTLSKSLFDAMLKEVKQQI